MQPDVPAEISILPLFGLVVYPFTVTPLAVSQHASVQLIDEALRKSGIIGVVTLRNEQTRPDPIAAEDCYAVGTAAIVHRLLRLPDGTLRVALEGIERIAIEKIIATGPFMHARVQLLPTAHGDSDAVEPHLQAVLAQVGTLSQLLPALDEGLQVELLGEESPLRLTSLIAANMLPHASVRERQSLLEENELRQRITQLGTLLERELVLAKRAHRALAPAAIPPGEPRMRGQRRELLALPIAESLIEQGRQAGFVEGQIVALEAVLQARFGTSAELETLMQQIAQAEHAPIKQLISLGASAQHLDELAAVLTTVIPPTP